MALDGNKRQVGDMRDTVKLAVNTSAEVRRKNVQYNNGFILLAGKYHLKFVVRENQSGRMGSFETDIEIPDLKTQPLKMSSVVMANQIQPSKNNRNKQSLGPRWLGNHSERHSRLLNRAASLSLLRSLRSGTRRSKQWQIKRWERFKHPASDQHRLFPREGEGL